MRKESPVSIDALIPRFQPPNSQVAPERRGCTVYGLAASSSGSGRLNSDPEFAFDGLT